MHEGSLWNYLHGYFNDSGLCNPAASCGTCCNKTQCYRLPLCVVLIMICCGLSNRVPHLCSWPIHWHSFLCFHRYPKKLIQTYSVFPNLVRTLTATVAPNNDGYESFLLRMKWVTWLFSPTIPYWLSDESFRRVGHMGISFYVCRTCHVYYALEQTLDIYSHCLEC